MTEKTVGWDHRLDGNEFEHTPGDGDRQGSLARCSPWRRKEWDTAEPLNNNDNNRFYHLMFTYDREKCPRDVLWSLHSFGHIRSHRMQHRDKQLHSVPTVKINYWALSTCSALFQAIYRAKKTRLYGNSSDLNWDLLITSYLTIGDSFILPRVLYYLP